MRYMLLAATTLVLALSGCHTEEPFDTQTPDDYPLILKPYNESGTGSYTYDIANPDTPMLDSCVVTPSNYVTVRWFLDGQLVCEGLKINACFPAGVYQLKITASTEKYETFRTGTVTVHPYAADPYSAVPAGGRYFVPGNETQIEGLNLAAVRKVLLTADLYAQDLTAAVEVTHAEDGLLRFVVPELENGAYFLRLIDAEGKVYGSEQAQIVHGSVALSGYQTFIPSTEWTISGLNLDKVASVSVGETTITNLTATANSVTLIAPELAEGDYTLQMKNSDGTEVIFITEEGLVNTVTTTCQIEKTLWEGPVNIDWNADLVKVTAEEMAAVPVGSTILVYWTEDPTPGYYAFRITTPWWGDDYSLADNFVVRQDTKDIPNPYTFEWDARCKALIEERGAMCVLGAGFTIDKICWK